MSVRIVIEVDDRDVETPDAELRAAAEALVLGAHDDVTDLFVRNLVGVNTTAFWRLAKLLGVKRVDGVRAAPPA